MLAIDTILFQWRRFHLLLAIHASLGIPSSCRSMCDLKSERLLFNERQSMTTLQPWMNHMNPYDFSASNSLLMSDRRDWAVQIGNARRSSAKTCANGVCHCTSCGEEITVPIDTSAGLKQEYVERCSQCSHQNVICVEVANSGDNRVWVVESSGTSGSLTLSSVRRHLEAICNRTAPAH